MELTQLRYFAAVAELQHVTRAAERMHVAQPAITKSIHRLEDELGVPLIASRGRNIVTACFANRWPLWIRFLIRCSS